MKLYDEETCCVKLAPPFDAIIEVQVNYQYQVFLHLDFKSRRPTSLALTRIITARFYNYRHEVRLIYVLDKELFL